MSSVLSARLKCELNTHRSNCCQNCKYHQITSRFAVWEYPGCPTKRRRRYLPPVAPRRLSPPDTLPLLHHPPVSDEPPVEDMECSRPKLTPEEKAARRRLQYKLHQRRHRARQQERTAELELEVCQLAETVATLNGERRRMLYDQRVFHSRGTLFGAPAKAANEYIRQLEHGYVRSRAIEQEQFLRHIMAPNVVGTEYEGVDQLLEQIRLYTQVFARTHLTGNVVDVSTVGDTTVVAVSVVININARRDGVVSLYPNLRDNEEIIQVLLSKVLHVSGRLLFVFDRIGACTWFGPDFDFVAALQRALGSLANVNVCLQDSNISSTGKITAAIQPLLLSERSPGDHRTSFYMLAH